MKKSMPRLDLLIDMLTLSCGLFMPIGEGTNRLIPHASLAYLFAGIFMCALVLVRCLFWSEPSSTRQGAQWRSFLHHFLDMGNLLVLLLFTVLSAFSIVECFRYRAIGLGAVVKAPLFLAIGMMLNVAVRMRTRRLHWFLLAFIVSFCASFLFIDGEIEANGVVRKIGTFTDPNSMARCAVLAALGCLYFCRMSRFRVLFILPMLIACYALYASGSRGPLIGVLVALIYIIGKAYWKKYWRRLLVVAGVTMVLLVTMYVANEHTGLAAMLRRYFAGSSEASSYTQNLRLSIWRAYVESAPRYMWWGMDTRMYAEISTHMTHNTFLYAFFRYGIFGALAYVAASLYLLVKSPSHRKGAVELKAIYIAFFISDLVIDSLTMRSNGVVLAFGLLAMSLRRRNIEIEGQNKNILIVRRNAGTFGGIEHQIIRIIRGLSCNGYRVALITDDSQSAFCRAAKDAGVKTLIMPLQLRVQAAWRLAKAIARERVDIVQSHMWLESMLIRLAIWLYPDVRHVFRVHTYINCSAIPKWKKRLYHCLAWLTDDAVDAYASINNFNVRELRSESYIAAEKLTVVHNAVPSIGSADSPQLRPWPPHKLAMVAHFVPGKGHDVLVKGLALAKRQGLVLQAALIGGDDENKGTQAAIIRLAEQQQVLEQLVLTGAVKNVASALDAIPIVVLPSDSEGTPNSLLEAMALKKLVIASSVGGIPEFIQDGVNGILHLPRSPQSFADALRKACNLSAVAMRKMCEAGYRTWSEYTLQHTITGLSAIYRRLDHLEKLL